MSANGEVLRRMFRGDIDNLTPAFSKAGVRSNGLVAATTAGAKSSSASSAFPTDLRPSLKSVRG